MTKSEATLPPSKRRLLAQHRKVMEQALSQWDEELKAATKDIVGVASKYAGSILVAPRAMEHKKSEMTPEVDPDMPAEGVGASDAPKKKD